MKALQHDFYKLGLILTTERKRESIIYIRHKLQRPELLRISLYCLRHYFRTITYHRTKDILYTQRKMGHRNLKNTLVYTHPVNFQSDEYIVRVAETIKEACKLVEAGFEYVTEMNNSKIFRKRK